MMKYTVHTTEIISECVEDNSLRNSYKAQNGLLEFLKIKSLK